MARAVSTAKEEKKYNFGEKKAEYVNGKTIPVTFITPKYKEAKAKAIELIESDKYKDILLESDFWILVNTYKNKTEAMYSGLIISHDGCLKINDELDKEDKFKPECMSLDKEGYGSSLVYTYNCPEQGLYEVGEVNSTNLKQSGYPYAMALKRCFDRVVLKNSKIAYSGIYSDSESEEFTKPEENITKPTKAKEEPNEEPKKKTTKDVKKDDSKDKTTIDVNWRDELVKYCTSNNIDINSVAITYKLNSKSTPKEFMNTLEILKLANKPTGVRGGENK